MTALAERSISNDSIPPIPDGITLRRKRIYEAFIKVIKGEEVVIGGLKTEDFRQKVAMLTQVRHENPQAKREELMEAIGTDSEHTLDQVKRYAVWRGYIKPEYGKLGEQKGRPTDREKGKRVEFDGPVEESVRIGSERHDVLENGVVLAFCGETEYVFPRDRSVFARVWEIKKDKDLRPPNALELDQQRDFLKCFPVPVEPSDEQISPDLKPQIERYIYTFARMQSPIETRVAMIRHLSKGLANDLKEEVIVQLILREQAVSALQQAFRPLEDMLAIATHGG